MIAIAYFKMKRRHLIVSGAAGATNSLSAAQLPRRGIAGVACLSVISTLVGMQRAYRVRYACCAFVREILFASSHLSGMRCGRAGVRSASTKYLGGCWGELPHQEQRLLSRGPNDLTRVFRVCAIPYAVRTFRSASPAGLKARTTRGHHARPRRPAR